MLQYTFFFQDIEDYSSDDDIDMLFNQLEQIAPPASLVDDIMQAVSRLTLPSIEENDLELGFAL
jgi:hypothetical protein